MTARRFAPTWSHLFQRLARPEGGASDTALLRRFIQQHDESAFELLTWRHGPMILGVCRRVLGDEHAAEDAFQAVLLVLARKARSISRKSSLAGWLYRVAYRAALRAREQARRRMQHEQQVARMPAVADPQQSIDPAWRELRQVLDEELRQLPEKYRAPLVLCYLEGLTNDEAARQLGCPAGTIRTRLARGRQVLAGRLTRRGLTLAAGLMTTALAPRAPAATLPQALVSSTIRAALAIAAGKTLAIGVVSAPVVHLTEGVLRAMTMAKLKLTAVIVATGLAVAGIGTASYRARAGEEGDAKTPPRTTPAQARVIQIKKEIARLKDDLRQAEEAAARERAMPPRGPVAIIFGDVPITRDELADHLLAHMSPQQLDSYITLRIVEHACRKEGITVTEADVDKAMQEHLRKGNLTEAALSEVLRRSNKTLREYRESVRTHVLLEQLARKRSISEKELRQAFEERYGEKIECDVLLWPSSDKEQARQAIRRLQRGEVTFEQLAQQQGSKRTVTIGPSQKSPEVRKAAFDLQPGEVSDLIERPERSQMIAVLKCRRRIPGDRSVRLDDVRESLQRELQGKSEGKNLADLLEKLRAEARVRRLWTPPDDPSSP